MAGLRVFPNEIWPFYDDRSINGLLAKIKQHLTPKKKRELSVKVCSRFRFYFICILFIFADENFIIKSSTASVYLPSLCNLFLRRIRFFIISECSFADMYRWYFCSLIHKSPRHLQFLSHDSGCYSSCESTKVYFLL